MDENVEEGDMEESQVGGRCGGEQCEMVVWGLVEETGV